MVTSPPKPSPSGLSFPNDWWGQETEFLNHLILKGDVVVVCDPGGVIVGVSEPVPDNGQYIVHGVADDPITPADDGGNNGEALDFMINGLSASPGTTWPTGVNTKFELAGALNYPGATVTAPENIGGVAGDAVLIQFRLENTGQRN